jgi:DNA-directed RNA polymerase specialized sigma subunit
MAKLSPKDNQLLHRLYFQGQTLNEIGRAWALTEGRICQLKKAALEELKARLEDDLDVDVAEL